MENGIGFIPQNTVQWHEQRRGKITSSQVYRLMSEPKTKADKEAGELSETGKKYILELIADEISEPNIGYEGEAIMWGRTYEHIARENYKKTIDPEYTVKTTGFLDKGEYGGSPDSIIYDIPAGLTVGVQEIKCPFETHNHLKYVLTEKFEDLPNEYYWQCVMNTFVCGAVWCDFTTFDPRIDSDLGLHTKREYASNMPFDKLTEQINKGIAYKKKIKTLLGLQLTKM